LRLMGDFDGASAYELLNTLRRNRNGVSRIIIDTNRLRRIHPFGRATLQCNLHSLNDKRLEFILTGDNASEIAPKVSEVV